MHFLFQLVRQEQLQHGDTNRSDVSRRSHQSGNRPVSPEMFRNVKPFKEFLIKEEKDTRDDMDTFHQIDHVRQVHVKGKVTVKRYLQPDVSRKLFWFPCFAGCGQTMPQTVPISNTKNPAIRESKLLEVNYR